MRMFNKWTAVGFGVGVGAGGTFFWFLDRHYKRKKEEQERAEWFAKLQRETRERVAKAQEAAQKNDEEKGNDISEYIAKTEDLKELIEENKRKQFVRDREEYLRQLQKNEYWGPDDDDVTPITEEGVELIEPPSKIVSDPYIITPHEANDRQSEGWELIEYKYFDDGVIADENGEELTLQEIEETVGADAVNHFGEYEEDSVYVRNERHRCDYAIYSYDTTYEEFLKTRPKPVLAADL